MVEKLAEQERHESMRGWFAYHLHARMLKDSHIWVVTGDLGYGMFDRIINVGAAEQLMMGVGVGLSIEGKIPVVYSITPFLLYRTLETIRNYVNREMINVKMVGGGRDRDYSHDGFSHWSEEDRQVMDLFKNIDCYWPETKEEVPDILSLMLDSNRPTYLNLRR